MTNYERIKAMSVEEMAKSFSDMYRFSCNSCRFYGYCDAIFATECVARWMKWIESEVET